MHLFVCIFHEACQLSYAWMEMFLATKNSCLKAYQPKKPVSFGKHVLWYACTYEIDFNP